MWDDKSNFSERNKEFGTKVKDRTPFIYRIHAGRVTFTISRMVQLPAVAEGEAPVETTDPSAPPVFGPWVLTASPWTLNRELKSEDVEGAQAEVIEIVRHYLRDMWGALAI